MYERQREFINTTQAGIDGCVLMQEAHIIMARLKFHNLNIHRSLANWILHTAPYKGRLPFLPPVATWASTLHNLFSMHSLLYCFILLTNGRLSFLGCCMWRKCCVLAGIKLLLKHSALPVVPRCILVQLCCSHKGPPRPWEVKRYHFVIAWHENTVSAAEVGIVCAGRVLVWSVVCICVCVYLEASYLFCLLFPLYF